MLQQIDYLQNNFTLVFKDMLASYKYFFFQINKGPLRIHTRPNQQKKKFNDKPHKTNLTKKAARLIIRKKLKTALTTQETQKIEAKMEDSSFALVSAHELQLKRVVNVFLELFYFKVYHPSRSYRAFSYDFTGTISGPCWSSKPILCEFNSFLM